MDKTNVREQELNGLPSKDGPASNVTSTEAPPTGPPAELRTFLIADIRGYTRFTQDNGDRMAAELVQKFASLTRQCVQSRGGELLELRGDEALAVFGSARQALRASVDLQARYARETLANPTLPLRVGIGIDAGEAVPIEGGYRGEALNLAARLCNLAGPGEVLATEGVVYLGRQVQGVTYAERGLVPIKGFADPVRVIRIMGAAASIPPTPSEPAQITTEHAEPTVPIGGFLGALPSGVLIGRESEWDQIMSLLESVLQGTGRLVLLSGEPGIGKTRLAQEVTLKARHWGFLVATGRCYQQEQNVPYYPFLEALASLNELCHPSVRAEVPRRWPYLGRLLPEEVGIVPTTSGQHEDQYLLFRAVTGFIEAIAETQPVALLVDDLHWADDSSVKLLQHLARYTRGHRVLLFGTYRDVDVHRQHPLETALLDLAREGLVDEVEVRRLDQAGTAALMTEILGEKEDLVDLAALLYRRTEGNAFYIGEMLRALVERGDVYREDDHWATREVREMEVPKSIRSVIGQRLSRLEEQAQEILREASVLGQEFAFDDLLALGAAVPPAVTRTSQGNKEPAWQEDETEGALEQALLAGLVRRTHNESYAFNHALTQQALYAELSPRRRRRLHRAAGEVLTRLPEGERDRRAGEMAWHFLEGDDPVLALHYTMVAGREAEEVFANREADRHYRTALELSRELGDMHAEIAALEALAGVLTIGARYEHALEILEQAAALHRELGNRDGEATDVAQIGYVYYLQGPPEAGIERLRPLVDAMEQEANASYGLACLWGSLSRLYLDIGAHEEQLKAADRALEIAEGSSDQEGLDRLVRSAELSRAGALWRLGNSDQALQVMEEVIPSAEAASDFDNLVRALSSTASFYARRGEYDKDRLYLERMLSVAERRGDRGHTVLGAMALSTNHFIVGNWEQTWSYLRRAEAVVSALGTTRLAIWPVTATAWLHLRQGDLDAAASRAQEGLELTGGEGDKEWRWNLLRLLAERSLLLGDGPAAMGRLEPVLEETGWKRIGGFLGTLAWAYLETGRTSEAEERATQAIDATRVRGGTPDLVESLIVRGMVMTRQDRWEEADRDFGEALSLARRLPYPFSEGRALHSQGLMYLRREQRESAERCLKDSQAIFERLGAQLDAEQTRLAMESLRQPAG